MKIELEEKDADIVQRALWEFAGRHTSVEAERARYLSYKFEPIQSLSIEDSITAGRAAYFAATGQTDPELSK